MTSGMDSNPEDEDADDQDADHDAGDRELPSMPTGIPHDKPEEDVLGQRQEVPYREDDPAAAGSFQGIPIVLAAQFVAQLQQQGHTGPPGPGGQTS